MRKYMGLMLAAACTCMLVSCSESPKGYISKNQPALSKTLGGLDAVAGSVSGQALDSDTISLPADSPVLSVDDIGNYAYQGDANAQLFTVQDFLDPAGQSPAMHLFPSRKLWQTVRTMVKDGRFETPEPESLQTLKAFSNWRYAVVLNTRSVQPPRVESDPVSTNVTDQAVDSSGTFTPGSIEGDALLYDLADARFLGGFPFAAQSSESVESITYGGGNANEGLQQQLDRDFIEQIKKAVFYGLIDRLPKDRVYMNGNLRQQVMTEKGKESE